MENKRKYRLGEVEETVSEMEFEDRCEEIVEVDENLQLLISGWYVFVPSLSLYLRAGVPVYMTKRQVCICLTLM